MFRSCATPLYMHRHFPEGTLVRLSTARTAVDCYNYYTGDRTAPAPRPQERPERTAKSRPLRSVRTSATASRRRRHRHQALPLMR